MSGKRSAVAAAVIVVALILFVMDRRAPNLGPQPTYTMHLAFSTISKLENAPTNVAYNAFPVASFTPIPSITPTPTITPMPTLIPAGGPENWTPVERELGGIRFVYVPPGCFMMGSTKWEDSQPIHEVCFDEGFWIGKTEVTNAQYRACVEAGACTEPSHYSDLCHYYDGSDYDNHPVNCVSWHNAKNYAAWLGKNLDIEVRLPTESEWEYAARGPEGRTYPWGEHIGCEVANYGGCVNDTVPVGSYPNGASWVGTLDMAGNAWEWLLTKWRPDYSTNEDNSPEGTEVRVLRSGAFSLIDRYARTAHRYRGNPFYRYNYFGFRIVLVRPPFYG